MSRFPAAVREPIALRQPAATLPLVLVGALVSTVALGAVITYSPKLAVVILFAICFVPIALRHVPLAICVWVAVSFLSATASVGAYANRLLLFSGLCWIGLLLGRRIGTRGSLAQNSRLIALIAVFLVWTLLTLAWAPEPNTAGTQIKQLLYGGFSVVFLLGVITERRHARWLAAAFVAGAALTVLWGAGKGGLTGGGAATEVADAAGRLQGGLGDPNYLGAVLFPAIVLAGGLSVGSTRVLRGLLALATVVIAIGLAASQSRGGLLAACVSSIVALVIWRERRALIAGLIAFSAAATAAYFLLRPGAWSRILESNNGSGRVSIWTIAWRIVHAHPFVGVGLGQFGQVSTHYVLQPGSLEYVDLLIEKGGAVHNMYLAEWVEGGAVGLLLLLSLIAASLACAWRAVRRFDALGDVQMASLSRAALLALVGLLVAFVFLSNLESAQLWILLAFGPVLLGLASRQERADAPSLTPPR